MTDLLDQKRSEIDARLQELKPLVDEYHRLDAAAQALDGITATSAPSTKTRRGNGHAKAPARPKRAATAGTEKRGRPKGSGTRDKEAVKIVTENPGIAISEIAMYMGIRPNYLHRVMKALVEKGLVVKDGKEYYPTGREQAQQESVPQPEVVNTA